MTQIYEDYYYCWFPINQVKMINKTWKQLNSPLTSALINIYEWFFKRNHSFKFPTCFHYHVSLISELSVCMWLWICVYSLWILFSELAQPMVWLHGFNPSTLWNTGRAYKYLLMPMTVCPLRKTKKGSLYHQDFFWLLISLPCKKQSYFLKDLFILLESWNYRERGKER